MTMQVREPRVVVVLDGRGWRLSARPAVAWRVPHHICGGNGVAQSRRGARFTFPYCPFTPLPEHRQTLGRNLASVAGFRVETQYPTLRIRNVAASKTADRLGPNEITLGSWHAHPALKSSTATGVGVADTHLRQLPNRRNAAGPLHEPSVRSPSSD